MFLQGFVFATTLFYSVFCPPPSFWDKLLPSNEKWLNIFHEKNISQFKYLTCFLCLWDLQIITFCFNLHFTQLLWSYTNTGLLFNVSSICFITPVCKWCDLIHCSCQGDKKIPIFFCPSWLWRVLYQKIVAVKVQLKLF